MTRKTKKKESSITSRSNELIEQNISQKINNSCLVQLIQTHSANTRIVRIGCTLDNCDGVVTNNRKLLLSIKVADCVPCFIYDKITGNFGLIHSGWRGTVNRIMNNAVLNMVRLGSRLTNIMVFMGPSICQMDYEVSKTVADQFRNENQVEGKNQKWYVHIAGEIQSELISFGLLKSNIRNADYCTFENNDCHSFRREGNLAGRMVAMAGYLWDY